MITLTLVKSSIIIIDEFIAFLILFQLLGLTYAKNKVAFWLQVITMMACDLIGVTFLPENGITVILWPAVQMTLVYFIFPTVRWFALLGVIIVKLTEMIGEIFGFLTLVYFFGYTQDDVVGNPIIFASFGALMIIVMLLIFYVCKSKNIVLNKRLIDNEQSKSRYKSNLRMIIVLFVVVNVIGIFMILQYEEALSKNHLALLALMIVEVVSIVLVFTIYKNSETKYQMMLQAELVKQKQEQLDIMIEQSRNVEQLFTQLRAERHDFVNHVQVLQGLIQSKLFDRAIEFVMQISAEVRQLNFIVVKENPFLSALLLVKIAESDRKGIHVDVKLGNNLQSVNWKPLELSVVIGNVINNAIEAFNAEKRGIGKTNQSTIWISSKLLDHDRIELVIGNNAAPIQHEVLQQILNDGFSTKVGHQGVGLASIKQIIDRIGATMDITSSDQEGTNFRFVLPTHSSVGQVSSGALRARDADHAG